MISLPKYLEIYGITTFSFLILLVPFILMSYEFCGTGNVATVGDYILKTMLICYGCMNTIWIILGTLLVIPYIPTCLAEKNVIVIYTLAFVISNGIMTLTAIIISAVKTYVSCTENRYNNRYGYAPISL
jgi:hypothetical protein